MHAWGASVVPEAGVGYQSYNITIKLFLTFWDGSHANPFMVKASFWGLLGLIFRNYYIF